MLDSLNNREKAIIIWIFVLLVWTLFQQNMRELLSGVLRAAFHKKIAIGFALMFSYVALIIFLFHKIHLWDISLLKDTIFWILGTAFVLFINLNDASKDENHFKKIIIENLKLILLLEFIINFYTFSLPLELILIPLLFIVVGMNIIAKSKEEFAPVKKLTDFVLGAWGIFLIIFVFSYAFNDYKNLLVDNLRTFLLPPCLTIAFLPFLYFFATFMVYEITFVRIDISVGRRDKELSKFAKRKILWTFGVNLWKLNKFLKENTGRLWGLKSEEDLLQIIQKFDKK